MIFGECPYCNEHISTGMPPDDVALPCFAILECEHCGKEFWERFSRLDPRAYKMEDIVLKDGKIVEIKGE